MDAILPHEHAGTLINAAALGLLGLALLGTLVRRLDSAIVLLAVQGVLLGVASGAAALAEMEWRAWAAFVVAVAVKAVVVPVILRHVLRRMAVQREVDVILPVKIAFPLAAALIPVAFYAVDPVSRQSLGAFDAPDALPAALGLLLLGLFTMVTRKKALTQVIGLVTMENGLYLAAVAATRGLPFAVEFGVAMDVLTGVAIMGLVIHEINRLLGTTNIDSLQTLRG
ncbi:MAG: hydrogenase-4 component [Thermomicrobiales bacterium]|jgi:hydrogenase-4 component E|nr:hydrogenase-4 component [Thermomicrobiales bacterium]MEA2524826.1 hydrogenase-4 component [Thermomicrobiales bacterium]MEA2582174.1 hydrogenase-4 component [Thermomicrobiales bacterium]